MMARHNAEPVRAPFERPVTPQLKGVRSGPLDQEAKLAPQQAAHPTG